MTPPELPPTTQQIPLQSFGPPQGPRFPPTPLPPPNQRTVSVHWWQHWWAVAGIAVVSLLFGIGIAAAGQQPATTKVASTPTPLVVANRPAPAVTVTKTVPGPTITTTVPGPTVTVTQAATAAPAAPAPDAGSGGGALWSGSGSGITNSRTFTASGQISIDYSYSNCTIPGFSVYVEGADAQDIPVTKEDSSGSGNAISYISGDVHLVMNTACHWRVSVTG